MGAVRDLWLRWKMLKLPWRKRFLIGQDLSGNTFWEFKDAINHNRLRRIVRYNRRVYHSDVQISPQWHQWLRQTRTDPPTLQEQAADVQRQTQLKHNARLADERWNAKKNYVDAPGTPKPNSAAETGIISATSAGDVAATTTDSAAPVRSSQAGTPPKRTEIQNPRKKTNDTASNPGTKWQPEAWAPGAARR